MIILIKMAVVLTLMVFLLKRKTAFGTAMLVSTLLLFALTEPSINSLSVSVYKTVTKPGTWFMLLTLYFVMCLEYSLRTSGILKDFTGAARRLFGSDRVLLGFMPAFLGFLPSLGGAIFSAPLVKEAGTRYKLSPERLTAINYWFRHLWEFSNPILPAMLLAGELTRIPIGAIIGNQFIFSIAAALLGIVFLLTGKPFKPQSIQQEQAADNNQESSEPECQRTTKAPELQAAGLTAKAAIRSILLATGPIIINLVLVVVFHMNTALALGLVLCGMAVILKYNPAKIKDMLMTSFDPQMLWGVITILFFQEMLDSTGTINQIVAVFKSSGIPSVAIISITAFIIGLLVGNPQGFVAVAFPLVIPLAPGNLDVVSMSYAAGLFGTMTSPAHLCQIVTMQYFKADFLKSLLPVIFLEILLVSFAITYLFVF